MSDNEKLKREISKRWYNVRNSPDAHAQLEYILQEAGLLAKPRGRKAKLSVAEATRTGIAT